MQSSVITTVFLPLALGIIMLGLGLSLTIADFRRVVVYPKAVIVGLVCQMAILPVVCFGIARAFGLPGELAVGLMLLAASPGGATANLYSHLAKGDVALNITLTAVNSVLSLFTLPFIVNFAMESFMGAGKAIPLQFDKVIQVFAIVLIPVAIGMVIRAKAASTAEKLSRPVKIISAVFLVLIVLAAILKDRASLAESFKIVGLAALAFNLISMGVGYFVPRLVGLPERQAIAIGMEIGIHNGTLAIAIATTLLLNNKMSIPPAIYSIIMFVTAAIFGSWVSKRVKDEPAATT
jgi:bile acid:Na+ symporter, BASS family